MYKNLHFSTSYKEELTTQDVSVNVALNEVILGTLPGVFLLSNSHIELASQSNVTCNEIGHDLFVEGLIISEPAGNIASNPLTSLKIKFVKIYDIT